jgi:plasmid maintenance system antidote protein VapI
MPYKIGPRVALRHYILEHLEAHKPPLTQRELAERLDCNELTVSRWINYKVKVTPDILAAIAEALGGDLMDWTDLLHHPDRPSANQLLRRLPEDEQNFYLKQLKNAAKQAG